MPINSGRSGFAGIVGIPALRRRSDLDPGVGKAAGHNGGPVGSGILLAGWRVRPFRSRPFDYRGYVISGVTRDSTGTPLPGCTVELFDTRTDQRVDSQVSDGSGNYSFGATGGPYYIVAYLAGAPDVAGTTVNTLTGV